jgi:hypothetical protein
MKAIIISFVFGLSVYSVCNAQTIGIGAPSPNSSAVLEVQSNSKGMLIPRMTSAQRAAISSPATGLMVFDNTTGSFWFKSAGNWIELVDTLNNVWKKNGADAYVGITGNVGIGTNVPGYNLHINRPNPRIGLTDTRDGSLSGYLEGNFLDLNMNASRVVFGGTPGNLTLQTNSAPFVITGNVGIGTLSPTAKLQVEGGSNATTLGGGYLQVGNTFTFNTGFDNNEIQARDNVIASKLFMQTSGGDLQIGGASNLIVKDGYQVYRNRPLSSNADLLPIAYGKISAAGTYLSGTGNLSVTKTGEGEYRIALLGESNMYVNRNQYAIHVSVFGKNIVAEPTMISAAIRSDDAIHVRGSSMDVNTETHYCCAVENPGNGFNPLNNFYLNGDVAFCIMIYKK